MKMVEAVYDRGMVRLIEPLALPDGTRVTVVIPEATAPAAAPPDGTQASAMNPAEILREIAAMSTRHGHPETSSVHHDRVLYGSPKGAP